MQVMEAITFALTHICLVLCIASFFVILRKSQRSQTQFVFFSIILVMFVWNVGTLLDIYYRLFYGASNMLFVVLCYFGICFAPIAVLSARAISLTAS